MKKEENKEPYKVKSFRMDEKTWNYLIKCKHRDKTWNLFFQELVDIIKYFKKL